MTLDQASVGLTYIMEAVSVLGGFEGNMYLHPTLACSQPPTTEAARHAPHPIAVDARQGATFVVQQVAVPDPQNLVYVQHDLQPVLHPALHFPAAIDVARQHIAHPAAHPHLDMGVSSGRVSGSPGVPALFAAPVLSLSSPSFEGLRPDRRSGGGPRSGIAPGTEISEGLTLRAAACAGLLDRSVCSGALGALRSSMPQQFPQALIKSAQAKRIFMIIVPPQHISILTLFHRISVRLSIMFMKKI